MKKLFLVLATLAALAVPTGAAAHPLGNFTVNRYAEIRLSGEDVFVHYALDLAEIPTLQEGERVRARTFAADVARGLVLEVDDRRATLTPLRQQVRTRPGAGGLNTLRFEAVYRADRRGSRVAFRSTVFDSRVGWREIVVSADRGARIDRSTVPATSTSKRLLAYPQDLLASPLNVSSAEASYTPGNAPGVPPAFGRATPPEHESSRFESLVSHDLTPGFVALSLLLAMFWGAAHAFSPGHGKAIVAGYLVGTRGTPRHAVLLGGIVTATHTIGVFALGLTTLALSEFFVPERLYPWLNLVAALLVVGVGVGVLRVRVAEWLRARTHIRAHARGKVHDHEHGHGHHHHHLEPGGGLRGLVGIGISGGIVPCPTALVVLLAAISLHRVGYGLVLIVAFSVGLAASITGIGLLAVLAKRTFGRMSFDGRLIRALPAVSAAVVVALGLAMTARAIPSLT